jgi:hypothetical protein
MTTTDIDITKAIAGVGAMTANVMTELSMLQQNIIVKALTLLEKLIQFAYEFSKLHSEAVEQATKDDAASTKSQGIGETLSGATTFGTTLAGPAGTGIQRKGAKYTAADTKLQDFQRGVDGLQSATPQAAVGQAAPQGAQGANQAGADQLARLRAEGLGADAPNLSPEAEAHLRTLQPREQEQAITDIKRQSRDTLKELREKVKDLSGGFEALSQLLSAFGQSVANASRGGLQVDSSNKILAKAKEEFTKAVAEFLNNAADKNTQTLRQYIDAAEARMRAAFETMGLIASASYRG